MNNAVIPARAGISVGRAAALLAETLVFAGVTAFPPETRDA
jgi:hypothetical protein